MMKVREWNSSQGMEWRYPRQPNWSLVWCHAQSRVPVGGSWRCPGSSYYRLPLESGQPSIRPTPRWFSCQNPVGSSIRAWSEEMRPDDCPLRLPAFSFPTVSLRERLSSHECALDAQDRVEQSVCHEALLCGRRLVMRHLDFSQSLGIRGTHLLGLGWLVLIFLQAESVITEQAGLFLFEVCGRLLHTKFFIVLAPG